MICKNLIITKIRILFQILHLHLIYRTLVHEQNYIGL